MKNAFFLFFSLLILSCIGQPENKKTEKDFLIIIEGKWNLSDMKGFSKSDIKDLNNIPFIKIEGNNISGTNGCNRFFSSINSIDKNSITFSPFGETKMMCQEMKIPDAFSLLVSSINTYLIETNTLVFLNKDGDKILTFTKD